MKKTKKMLSLFLAAILLFCAALALYYFSPRTFLKGVSPNDISEIKVFDGTNGKSFSIKDSKEIEKIISAIQSVQMKRGKISVGYSGFSLALTFLNKNEKVIDGFIINGDSFIRDDPFFYEGNSSLGFDYLKELELKYIE